MTRVYRILRRPFSKSPLDGEGAWRYGGRWSSPGTRLAYTAEHVSLAMIEYFVHLDPDDPPKDLVLVEAEIPAGVSRIQVAQRQLLANWRATPPPSGLAQIGDAFAQAGRAAILVVPSALSPAESNWLVNPAHPEFIRIRVHPARPFQYDSRFFI